MLYTLNSVSTANDLYLRDAKGVVSKLTDVNQAMEAEVDDVFVQRFDFAGANGDQVWGQITKPVGVKGKLPVAFIVHGGPQGSFGNGWSFRWNPRVMASQGYAVVSVDFHGLNRLRPEIHRQRSTRIGAAGRLRICKRDWLRLARSMPRSTSPMPALWAAPMAAI